MASRIWRPDGWTPGDPVKLLLLVHAAGGTADSPFGVVAEDAMDAALAAGYTLLADDAQDRAWGNLPSQADYVAAYDALAATDTIVGTVLWCASMGGLPAFSIAANASIPNVRGILAMYPVLSLANFYADKAGYRAEIDTAYGAASGQGATVAATQDCDPYLRSTGLFAEVPARICHSAADTVVAKARHMDAWVTRFGGVQSITTQTTTGEHGDASNWVWSDFAEWLDTAFLILSGRSWQLPYQVRNTTGRSWQLPYTVNDSLPKDWPALRRIVPGVVTADWPARRRIISEPTTPPAAIDTAVAASDAFSDHLHVEVLA